MKKIYSFFTFALVACCVGLLLSSCSKDDPINGGSSSGGSSSGGSGDSGSATLHKFVADYRIATDALDFFDVTVTRTCGSKTQNYNFSTDGKITVMETLTTTKDIAAKCYKDELSVTVGDKVTITATLKAKSNWEEIAKAKGDDVVYCYAYTNPAITTSSSISTTGITGGVEQKASKITEEWLAKAATTLQKAFEYEGTAK